MPISPNQSRKKTPQQKSPSKPAVMRRNVSSPLAWFRARDDGFFAPEELDAGERLAQDFQRGALNQVRSIDLQPRVSSSTGQSSVAESTLDAQDRFRAALAHQGAGQANLLIDICCFEKSLTSIEQKHRWPRRSAKVALKLALSALADHYRAHSRVSRLRNHSAS